GTSPRGVRSNSRDPSRSSASNNARLTADWVRCRDAAARAVLPTRATARITCRSLTSSLGLGSPMRMTHPSYANDALDAFPGGRHIQHSPSPEEMSRAALLLSHVQFAGGPDRAV